ncbi:hypothetical protein KJ855_02700, partial [Patescibacteria group bacterium]|nr:hypothetical protein [Patescibacteria group bacterium]
FFINIVFALYGLAVYFGFPGNLYNASLPPTDTFYFLSLGLPILIGLCFHYSFFHSKAKYIVFTLVIIGLVVVTNLIYPWSGINIKVNDNYQWFDIQNTTQNELPAALPTDNTNQNYRFAHNDSHIAVWFNYDYPNIAQTRDYYSQALLNQNDKFWFENAVFALDNNYNETQYLMDWMAVKWFSVQFPNFNFDKFDTRPDLFTHVSDNGNPIKEERIDVYEYKNPRPIIEATNAKTILVIGDEASYRNLLLSLAQTDLYSDKIIPIQGNQFVDLYILEDLQKYDSVLLYNFSWIEKERAFTLLDQYVYQGGHLLIESSSILSKPEGVTAFLPAPVKTINPGEFGESWNFEVGDDQIILDDVNLEDFGPAIYGGDKPWGMLYADEENLRDNAKSVLKNHGHTVIASMDHGQGRVMWSGLNLFYHFNNYHSTSEKRLIENIIDDLTGVSSSDFQNQPGEILDAQKRQVVLEEDSDYTGILVKENYFPNWMAYYQTTDGKAHKLDIDPSGLGMMYIDLPTDIEGSYTFYMKYRKSWLEWVFISLSLIYFIWMIITHLVMPEQKPAEILTKKTNIENKNKKTKWNPKHRKYESKKRK